MRLILFTGKGGVGKSSMATATAARAASCGSKTLVVSSDLAHNLTDILGKTIGQECVLVQENLWALEVDILTEIRRNWSSMQEYLAGLMTYLGVDDAVAEEAALVPGIEEFFMLERIRREVESGKFETIVVDCSPTGGTLRLLTLSDSSAKHMQKIIDIERLILKLVRPFTNRMKSIKPVIPKDELYDTFGEICEGIGRLGDLLKDVDQSSVRLVLTPERVAVAETKRAFTYLSLFGFNVDAVLVNKIFPSEVKDGYFGPWQKLQQEQIDVIERSFLDRPIFKVPYLESEPLGVDTLSSLGEQIYDGKKPDEIFAKKQSVVLSKEDGKTCLSFHLPNVDKSRLDIGLRGNEMFITAGNYVRIIALPDSLTDSEIGKAKFDDGRLKITFHRDEAAEA